MKTNFSFTITNIPQHVLDGFWKQANEVLEEKGDGKIEAVTQIELDYSNLEYWVFQRIMAQMMANYSFNKLTEPQKQAV